MNIDLVATAGCRGVAIYLKVDHLPAALSSGLTPVNADNGCGAILCKTIRHVRRMISQVNALSAFDVTPSMWRFRPETA
jgi:hypothetical protein